MCHGFADCRVWWSWFRYKSEKSNQLWVWIRDYGLQFIEEEKKLMQVCSEFEYAKRGWCWVPVHGCEMVLQVVLWVFTVRHERELIKLQRIVLGENLPKQTWREICVDVSTTTETSEIRSATPTAPPAPASSSCNEERKSLNSGYVVLL